jgi:PAS domain S-box-containing protein
MAIDHSFTIIAFNSQAERLLGYPRSEALGKHCFDLLRTTRCGDECPVRVAMRTGQPQRNQLLSAAHSRGRRVWLCITACPFYTRGGELVGGIEVIRPANCIRDTCCEQPGPDGCEHGERAVVIRHAESAHARPSNRAILAAPVRPEDPTNRTAEAEKLLAVLQAHGWNRQRTAEVLGISRSTLWRRMKDFGIIGSTTAGT